MTSQNTKKHSDENPIISVALELPMFGAHRAAEELRRRGIIVSSNQVINVWKHHSLNSIESRLRTLYDRCHQENLNFSDLLNQSLQLANSRYHGKGKRYFLFQGLIRHLDKIRPEIVVDYERIDVLIAYDPSSRSQVRELLSKVILQSSEASPDILTSTGSVADDNPKDGFLAKDIRELWSELRENIDPSLLEE